MDLQVELLGEVLVAVGASELGHSHMDHLSVLVKVAFLGELHLAVVTDVGLLSSMSS